MNETTNRPKPGHKITMIVAGILLASCVIYNVVDFIGGMMYFISPQPGAIPSYHAVYEGFYLTGPSRVTFDSITIEDPSKVSADFVVRLPSGDELAVGDPSLKRALVDAGAEESGVGGVESLTIGDLYFQCDDEAVSAIVADEGDGSRVTTLREPRLLYRGTVLLFPMSVPEMRRIFGRSYRIVYR